MSLGRRRALLSLLVVLGFALQAAVGSSLQTGRARPDLGLCALLMACLFIGANTGAVLGFALGLMEGSWTAMYLGSYIVSRTLLGFAVGALEERVFRENALVAMAVALLGTAAVEALFYLFVPQPHLLRMAVRIGLEAVYNSALALPLFLTVRALLRRAERRTI